MKERAWGSASNVVEVSAQGLPCRLAEEHAVGYVIALAFHVVKVFSTVLLEVKADKFRDPEGRV